MKVSVNKILPFILLIVKYLLIFNISRLYGHNLLNICGIIIFTESWIIKMEFIPSPPLSSQIVVGDLPHGMVNGLLPCPDRGQVDEDLSRPVVGFLAFGLVCKTIPFLLPIHNGTL